MIELEVQQARADDATFRRPVQYMPILRGKRKPQFTVHVRPQSTSNRKGA